MKTKLFLIGFLVVFFAGCAWFQVQTNRLQFANNLGYQSAKIVLANNPSYLPEAKQGIQDGLAIVTGDNIDPARALQGIIDFANKLTEGNYQEYRDVVTQVLDLLKGLVELHMNIPEEKQEAAQIIAAFLTGAQQGIDEIQ